MKYRSLNALYVAVAVTAYAGGAAAQGPDQRSFRNPYLSSPCEGSGWRPPECHSGDPGSAPPPPDIELGGKRIYPEQQVRSPDPQQGSATAASSARPKPASITPAATKPAVGSGRQPSLARYISLNRCVEIYGSLSLSSGNKAEMQSVAEGISLLALDEGVANGMTKQQVIDDMQQRENSPENKALWTDKNSKKFIAYKSWCEANNVYALGHRRDVSDRNSNR